MRNSTVLLQSRQPSSAPSTQPARKPLPAGNLYRPMTSRKFHVTYRIGVKEHTADRVAESADCARAHFELYRYSVVNVVEIDAAGNEVIQQSAKGGQHTAAKTAAPQAKPHNRVKRTFVTDDQPYDAPKIAYRSPLRRKLEQLASGKGMTIQQLAAHFSFASESELLRTAAAAKDESYVSLAAAGRDKGVTLGTPLAECFGVADHQTACSATA